MQVPVSMIPLGTGVILGGLLVGLVLAGRHRLAVSHARLAEGRERARAEAALAAERERRTALEYEAAQLKTDRSELERSLAAVRRDLIHAETAVQEQGAFLEHSKEAMQHAFQALAATALEGNAKQFLTLAQQQLAKTQIQSESDLEQRKLAVEGLVQPLRETLVKLEEKTGKLETARVDAYARISEHVQALATQTLRLEERAAALDAALRGSPTRGRWGEVALRNIVELAGMTEHCDFHEQSTLDGGKRPDMVVKLPGGRSVVVDAKAPLTAYLQAMESTSASERDALMERHARALRGHVRSLSRRNYAAMVEGEIDLVVLFLPGDSFLSAAYSALPDLHTEALAAKVLIAAPTSLVALLRTVAMTWQERTLAENTERVAGLARDLYDRTAQFAGHLDAVGKGLGQAVKAYGEAAGSFERRLLPLGRRLEELRVTETSSKQLEPLRSVPEPRPGRAAPARGETPA